MTELSAQRAKMPWLYANSARMFVTNPSWKDGTNGAVENSSLFVLVDTIRIHITGSTQYNAPITRMTVGIRLIREPRRCPMVAASGWAAVASANAAHALLQACRVWRR